ncbi:MAG TPA: response regulator [Clostridia bacterium]|nr:response regulator [Clostridia bacterium]
MDGTILLMDYSAYERQKIRHIIEKIGYFNIIEVGDNNQFKLLNTDIADLKLIIMDLAFPAETDGFAALSKLRSAPVRTVPIIIVTQADRSDLKSAALRYGVNDYIVKPYQLKRLESSINSLVKTEKTFRYDTSEINDIRMSFDSYVEREIKYSKRTGAPLSLILITTLQLYSAAGSEKSITDEYKASVFNIAAKKAREALRATDTIVLNHGRDIIIVLPCTDETGARLVSEKIKAYTEPEFEKINSNRNEYIYPVYVAYPKEGDSFQALMQTAFRKIADKEMLEKITSIPSDTRKYADKSYNRYRKWW